MTRVNNWLRVVVVTRMAVIMAGVLCTSCKGTQNSEYLVGVLGPFTGEGATYGDAMKRGIELAVEETNSKGGIDGIQLRAVYEDSMLQPKTGIDGFNKLVRAQQVPVVIGEAASRVTKALAPLAEGSRVVLISPISTTDSLRDAGDYVFRNVPSNSVQGATAAEFVTGRLSAGRIAIYYKNDEYGLDLTAGFKRGLQDTPAQVVFTDAYESEQRDFRDSLTKVKAANPDLVYFPGNYQESAIILKQAKELGISATFVGGDGSYSPELCKIAGKAAEGTYYTLMALPEVDSNRAKAFKDAFSKRYSMEPGVYDAYSYDAMMVVAEAIRKGGYTGPGMKDAMYEIELDGVTGKTRFDKYGDVDKPYAVYVVKDGSFVRVPATQQDAH